MLCRKQPLYPLFAPQTRTVGSTFEFSFILPEPANAGGGPKRDRKTGDATKGKQPQTKIKKPAKNPQSQAKPKEG